MNYTINESQTIEMMFEQQPYSNYNATFIQVSKLELGEKYQEILWKKGMARTREEEPDLVIFTIQDREAIYLFEYIPPYTKQVNVY